MLSAIPSWWRQRKRLPWGTAEATVQQLLQKQHISMSRALKGKANQCLLHGSKKAGGPAYLWRLQMKYRMAHSWCHQEGDTGLSLLFLPSDCTELAWWCGRGLKRQEAEFVVSLTSQTPKLTIEKVWQALEVNGVKFFWKGNSCNTVEEKQAQGLVSFRLHPTQKTIFCARVTELSDLLLFSSSLKTWLKIHSLWCSP